MLDDWLKEIDRGGLKHVTNMVFASGESELRKHINESKSPDFNLKSAKDKLIQCEDVQFYWSIVACNWEEETATVLLEMLIEEWIGHSTATAWLEQYKTEKKKYITIITRYVNHLIT